MPTTPPRHSNRQPWARYAVAGALLALGGCANTPPPAAAPPPRHGPAHPPAKPKGSPKPAAHKAPAKPAPPKPAANAMPAPLPRWIDLPRATGPLPPPSAAVVPGVTGLGVAALIAQFGPPRLNQREGDVRKLQFAGKPCVLDIYLYPPSAGAAPVASYIDARRPSDGREVERAPCVAALKKR